MKKMLLTLGSLVLLTLAAFAQDPDLKAMLAKYDEMMNFTNTDQSARVTIVTRKPGEADDVMTCQFFRRDNEKKTLILILKPEANKGSGLLMIGDDVTIFYDPESRKFSTVAKSGSFQNSDVKNSDFEAPQYSKKYDIIESKREKLGAKDTWALTLKANTTTVAYPKVKMWLEAGTNLCLKMERYSLSDRLMNTSLFAKYTKIEGHFIAQTQVYEDNLKKGEKSVLTLEAVSLAKLPENTFTKERIEQVNQ